MSVIVAVCCAASGCSSGDHVPAMTSSSTAPSSAPPSSAPPSSAAPSTAGRELSGVFTTGYSWFDNTPAGSALISHPRRHQRAGGLGTYEDPITLAVGHSRASGRHVLDLPAGTRVYVAHVRRYFIVEDTCGDGPRPQDGPCHDLSEAPAGARLWLDLYVGGGEGDRREDVQACARTITSAASSLHTVVIDPGPGRPVVTGPLFGEDGCTPVFRDRG